jgi:hypothetical protein
MPGFDRTGPEGKGSRTGRGLGRCNPKNSEKNDDQLDDFRPVGRMGRGYRRGRGRGLGRNRNLS